MVDTKKKKKIKEETAVSVERSSSFFALLQNLDINP